MPILLSLILCVASPEAGIDPDPAAILERLGEARGLDAIPTLATGATFQAETGGCIRIPGALPDMGRWPEPALAFALAHEWSHLRSDHPRRLRASRALLLASGADGVPAPPLDWELAADADALEWITEAGYPPYAALDALDAYAQPSPRQWARRIALARAIGG